MPTTATAVKPVKKVKLMDKRINFAKVGDYTFQQVFGKVSTVGQVTKKLWKLYKEEELLLD